MPYVSEQGIRNLSLYKYSGEDRSLLVKLFFRSFWNWCVTLFPVWMAPNLITTMGFVCIVTSYAFFCVSAPGFAEDVEPWVYYYFAVMIFVYQVLDNVDGRQARRTGSSSALGEFFDHACDSLFVTLALVPTLHATGVGAWEVFVMYNIWGIIPFFLSHWEEYYASILVLGQVANPTEAQLIQCSVFILSGIYGRGFWVGSVELFGRDVELYVLLTGVQVVVVVYGFLDSFRIICENIQQKAGTKEDWQKMNVPQALSLLFPIIFLITSSTFWFSHSPNHILTSYPHHCFLVYGFIFASILNRLMVDRITKIPTSPFHWQLLIPLVGAITSIYTDVDDVLVLHVGLGVLVVTYFHFVCGIISQFCEALGIQCFRIPYKNVEKEK